MSKTLFDWEFHNEWLIPILYEDAPNYITNRKGRKEHKEGDKEI